MKNETRLALILKEAEHQLSQGAFRAAHGACIEVLKSDPDNAEAFYLLGRLTAQHDNHTKACELYSRAIALDGKAARYYAYFAQVLTILGRQNHAKDVIDQAANLPIEDAYVADTIGVVYSRTGFHEKAIPFFEKAVSMDMRPANFHYNMAASHQFLGEFSKAELAYQSTLSRDPAHYRAWSSLVALARQTPKTNHLDQLVLLFEQHSSNADAALHLGHAIAKTLEDLGRYEESLQWLQKAKEKKRNSLPSNSFNYSGLFEAAKQTSQSLQSSAGTEATSASPIFIFGLPRTGTTLVDRILSSHPDVVSAGELNVFAGLIKEATQTRSNMVMDPETLIAASDIPMDTIGQMYIKNTIELARGADRMTDKMPLNFFYAALIHRAMPNAKMIVLRRGAMDSCLSNYRQLFTVQHSYYNYTYDLADTAQFYQGFDHLMTQWRDVLPANRFMEVRYENIVHDQENQTRRLLEFCDLPWNDACMRFHENSAPVSTASSVQVRQPLYSGSIGRWKRYGEQLNGLLSDLRNLAED
ncbi:MAG: protein-tyrosine sulfotransferase [Robiginitomaculum sp.]|nr:MAG: protein-tyrosine sulfotransferase [Robiginitomaculum sp.]